VEEERSSSMSTLVNRYPGKCSCGKQVGAGAGTAIRINGRWHVRCAECLKPEPNPNNGRRAIEADGTIWIPYSDSPEQRSLLRSFPVPYGARSPWDPEKKVWRASVERADLRRTLELARRLDLEIAPELLEQEKETTEEAKAAAQIDGLYAFQIDGVEFLASGERRLLGDDQGTGKTVQTLAALPRSGYLPPVLAIVPSSVKFNWKIEAAKWAPQYKAVVLSGRKSFRWPVAGEIVIINYDILPKAAERTKNMKGDALKTHEEFIESTPKGMVLVVDEVHNCRNNSGRMRKVRGIAGASARVWGLTGTPLMNHPDQLYRVLRTIGCAYKALGSWQTFLRLFNAVPCQYGGYEWGAPAAEVPERLRRVMLRRVKAEVLPDLPPKRYQVLTVNGVDKSLKREMDLLWEEWQDVIEAGELPPFEEFSRMRRMLAAARTPIVLDWVEPYEAAETPIVVMSAHRAPIDALGERDGWETITGSVSSDQRQQIVERFQAGELKGLACTIGAAKEGLTLTRASTMLFVDLDWTPALNIQAQDRIHRIGQMAEGVLYVRMTSEHPLDQHVSALIARKMELIERSIEKLIQVDANAIKAETEARADRDRRLREAAAAAEKEEARVRCLEIQNKQVAKLGNSAKELELTDERVEAINAALKSMLEVCDGAVLKDGEGFNKPDAARSRWLYRLGLEEEDAQRAALSMLQSYQRQLRDTYPILWSDEKVEVS
jgi:superfamily II DNA or RNA helicase